MEEAPGPKCCFGELYRLLYTCGTSVKLHCIDIDLKFSMKYKEKKLKISFITGRTTGDWRGRWGRRLQWTWLWLLAGHEAVVVDFGKEEWNSEKQRWKDTGTESTKREVTIRPLDDWSWLFPRKGDG